MQKNKFIIIAVAAVLVLALAIGGVLLSRSQPEEEKNPTIDVTDDDPNYKTIETVYCPIRLSAGNSDRIYHMEAREGKIAIEVFYMYMDTGERELFRIYFGDSTRGDVIGKLLTEDGTVWVSVAVSSYTNEDFADEKELQQYQTLMDEVNVVLYSIRSAGNFVAGDQVPGEETQLVEIEYWKVDLPKNIKLEEMRDGDKYRADFYATIGGESLLLYTVHVGQSDSGTLLGTYTVDGVAKSVSIEPSQSAGQLAAENTEYAVLMETINDVVQTISSSQYFAEKEGK